MWVFTKYGFFSIACARNSNGEVGQDTVMVRARGDEHPRNLQERFPGTVIAAAKIQINRGTDYKFRIIVPKRDWLSALSEMASEQSWSNFKNEAASFARLKKQGSAYLQALHQVWESMSQLQSNASK